LWARCCVFRLANTAQPSEYGGVKNWAAAGDLETQKAQEFLLASPNSFPISFPPNPYSFPFLTKGLFGLHLMFGEDIKNSNGQLIFDHPVQKYVNMCAALQAFKRP
jgi:hypothetical protein